MVGVSVKNEILLKIYKYINPARIDILELGLIRYSQPKSFNDPFEIGLTLSGIADENTFKAYVMAEIQKMIKESNPNLPPEISKSDLERFVQDESNKSLVNDILKSIHLRETPNMKQALLDSFLEHAGILSLTENPSNLLMWAHYADHHRGFVIGLDGSHPYFDERKSTEDMFRHLRKVEYRNLRPNIKLVNMTPADLYLVKSPEWSHEQEWRILRALDHCDKTLANKNAPFPIHLFKIPAAAIREIILGSRSSDEFSERMKTVLNNSPDLKHVKLCRAKLHESEFRLEIGEI